MKGEFKGWAGLIQGQLRSDFPLTAYTPLPPDNQQLLLADRNRWAKKAAEQSPLGNTNAPAASADSTNQPAAPDATNTKPASE